MSQFGSDSSLIPTETLRYIQFQQTAVDNSVSQTPNYGNVLRITFPYPQSFGNCQLALADLYIFNSWFNVSAALGNNVFQYTYPVGAGFNTYTVVVKDGNYSIDTLNEYFEAAQVVNGTYLIDPNGNNVYYIYWVVNSAAYRVTLYSNPVPTALPTNYTLPANYPAGGLPTAAVDPQLIILPTGAPAGSNTPGFYSFSKTLGFLPGTYPPGATATPYVMDGQVAPAIEYTSCVNVACSMVNNGTISPFSNVFYSFSPTVPFGSQINVAPPWPRWVPVAGGFQNYIEIAFTDDQNRPLALQDPHISGTIIVRGR